MSSQTSSFLNVPFEETFNIRDLFSINKPEILRFSGLGRTSDAHSWTREACTSAKGAGLLERKQARACRAAPDVMPSLVQAAKDTSTVCQQAFRHRRWNCSSIERAPDYTPELLTGLRDKRSCLCPFYACLYRVILCCIHNLDKN